MALSCGTKVLKYILFVFNFIFWASGCVLLGIGIWILTAHSSAAQYLHVANLDYGLVEAAAITIIVVGSLVFVVGALGCCGACKENNTCLTAFSGILIVLLILQLIAVILAGSMHSQIIHGLGAAMNTTMVNNFAQPKNTLETEGWNYMQVQLVCCGVGNEGPSEWEYTNWWRYNRTDPNEIVPVSCCANLAKPINFNNLTSTNATACYLAASADPKQKDRSKYVNVNGCEKSLDNLFLSSLGVLIGGTVAVILAQIIVVVMACCLRRSIKENYEHV